MKYINTYLVEKLKISKNNLGKYTLFPKSKDELVEMIHDEIKRNGNSCSLNHIDVSSIDNMSFLFSNPMSTTDKVFYYELHNFKGDISKWDTSNVTDMSYMFHKSLFNGDISEWDVSNVKIMRCMFDHSKFNGDISNWDVSNVIDMGLMFKESSFDNDISYWDVSNVINMNSMFDTSEFNRDISNWDVSSVTNMSWMFFDSIFKLPYIYILLIYKFLLRRIVITLPFTFFRSTAPWSRLSSAFVR